MNRKDYISYKIKKLQEEKKYQYGGITGNLGQYFTQPQIPQPITDYSVMQPFTQNLWNTQQTIPTQTEGITINPSDTSFNVENPEIFTNQEQLNRMQQNNALNSYLNNYDTEGQAIDTNLTQPNTAYNIQNQLLNPYTGVNLETALFNLGRSLNYDGEQRTANTIRGGAAAGKILLGGARTLLSGSGYQNRNDYQQNDFFNRLYNSAPNYQAFQKGGTVTNGQIMTGNFIADQGQGLVELENNEQVLNSATGDVQQVIGNTHEQGGVKTDLPSGSMVLSDHTKIGAQKAKLFRKEFDMKIKASDTYADVMDKYNKKIGFKDLLSTEEETIGEIENQVETNTVTATKDINMNYLSDKMQQVQSDKDNLKILQQDAFNKLFVQQEGEKYPEEVVALASQYNLSPERAMELVKMQDGGTYQGFFTPSMYASDPYTYQPFTAGVSGAAGLENEAQVLERLRYQNQQLPYLFEQSGIYSNNAGDFPLLSNTAQFQQSYDNYIDVVNTEIDQSPFLTDSQKQAAKQQANSQRLALSNQNGNYDNLYGFETSTRTNFNLPYLTQTERDEYPELNFIGQAVDENGNIREEFSNLSPETQQRILDTYGRNSTVGLNIGLGVIPTQETVTPTGTEVATQPDIQNVTQYEMAALPVDYIMPPSPASPVYKSDVTLSRLDPTNISPEANIIEAERQRQAVQDSLQGLPDSQRAAALGQLLSQTQSATNQAITAAETANAQQEFQVAQYNAQQADKQQLLNEQFAKTYEAQTFATDANTRRDLQTFYQTLNAQQRSNFADVRDLNLLNQLYPNFATNGQTVTYRDSTGNVFTTNNILSANYNTLDENGKAAWQRERGKALARSQTSATNTLRRR